MESKKHIKMTSDVVNIINDIEDKFPVDEWIIEKIHIWPLIRLSIFLTLTRTYVLNSDEYLKSRFSKMVKLLKLFENIIRYSFAYLIDYKKNSKFRQSKVIFLNDGVSFQKINNKWYSKFCDPFFDYFKSKNISSIMMTPLGEYFIPRYNPSIFIQPYIDYFRVKSSLISKSKKVWNEQLPEFLIFLDYINNLNISNITLQSIRKQVILISLIADFFKKIFIKVRPSLGMLVSYYGVVGFAFNLACRDFGIPSIDIQHGIQGDLHLAYGSWNKVPETGYELLPTLFWCWSENEAASIYKWSQKVSNWHKPIVGGNLFLNYWLSDNSYLVKCYDKKIEAFKNSLKYSRYIIFTQSHPQGKDVENIIPVIKNSPSCWFWLIRIHPCNLKIRYDVKKLLRRNRLVNCEVDIATDYPLYALFRHSDVHVTEISSSVIEAEIFGVPSVITNKCAVERFTSQIENGWAVLAYTTEDIIKAINYQLEKRCILKQNQKKVLISSKNALEFLTQLILKEGNQDDK